MKVIIIGAGIGGLATSIRLRVAGHEVAIYEAASQPGGKLSEIRANGFRWDAGPSLFTMPQLVTELFELAGKRSEDFFEFEALPIITRYFYEDGTLINAFHEPEAFIQELLLKTDEKETNIRSLLAKSAELYEITNHVFLERSLHKLSTYLRKETLRSALQVHKLDAFRSMHNSNAKRFADPRVVQLFDRYATYNGSDPYQAPATLNIIPHLEHSMGAFFPKGGMYAITQALFELAQDLGVDFHFETPVQRITVDKDKVSGIEVDGEQIAADAVVSNADIVPTYRKLLPAQKAPEMVLSQPRSSSALIFYWGMNRTFPQLDTHNIFFSENYEEEFRQIWKTKSLSSDPTVYVFVSSKVEPTDAPTDCENWFVMINTPANTGQDWDKMIAEARKHILQKLDRNLGEEVENHIISESILDPRSIELRTSSHQGALYGSSSNNPMAAFLRHPNFSRKLAGLYFCGGSVHPGGGIPLCLLSARIATDCMEEDFAKS